MDKATAQQLGAMQTREFNAACEVLRDSGFDDVADDWIASRQAFKELRRWSPTGVLGPVQQAYARMRMQCFPISQIRATAQRRLEHHDPR